MKITGDRKVVVGWVVGPVAGSVAGSAWCARSIEQSHAEPVTGRQALQRPPVRGAVALVADAVIDQDAMVLGREVGAGGVEQGQGPFAVGEDAIGDRSVIGRTGDGRVFLVAGSGSGSGSREQDSPNLNRDRGSAE